MRQMEALGVQEVLVPDAAVAEDGLRLERVEDVAVPAEGVERESAAAPGETLQSASRSAETRSRAARAAAPTATRRMLKKEWREPRRSGNDGSWSGLGG
jgi:hypothetical protein